MIHRYPYRCIRHNSQQKTHTAGWYEQVINTQVTYLSQSNAFRLADDACSTHLNLFRERLATFPPLFLPLLRQLFAVGRVTSLQLGHLTTIRLHRYFHFLLNTHTTHTNLSSTQSSCDQTCNISDLSVGLNMSHDSVFNVLIGPNYNKTASSNLGTGIAGVHICSTVLVRWRQCPHPSNTHPICPTPLFIPNGSSNSSAVFAWPHILPISYISR